MQVDEPLRKLRMIAGTEQSRRAEAVPILLTPDECSLIIAEVDVLRVQWRGYVGQRDIARDEAVKQRNIVDDLLSAIDKARQKS